MCGLRGTLRGTLCERCSLPKTPLLWYRIYGVNHDNIKLSKLGGGGYKKNVFVCLKCHILAKII